MDAVEDESGFFDYDINGSFVENLFYGEDSFLEIIVSESTSTLSVTGPGQARNAHVQKLNEEVKRREWREKSGMTSSADEDEDNAGPENVLDDIFDRQVTQALTFSPIRYARGSMFGALNDVPSPVESLSAASTLSRQSGGNEEEATGGSDMPMRWKRDSTE